MVDLRWHDAYSASRGAFTAQEKAGGWPDRMTPVQLAALQRPYVYGDKAGRRACWALRDAIEAASEAGSLAHEALTEVKQTPLVDRSPIPFPGSSRWPAAYVVEGRPVAYTSGGEEYTVTHRHVSPQAFAAWLHAQGQEPSGHIAAWFEVRGVAWPPVAQALLEVPSGLESLRASRATRRKNAPWTPEQVEALRALFQERGGWKRSADGAGWSRDAAVQQQLATDLGLTRQALDGHLGRHGPESGAPVFRSMSSALTRTG